MLLTWNTQPEMHSVGTKTQYILLLLFSSLGQIVKRSTLTETLLVRCGCYKAQLSFKALNALCPQQCLNL